MAEPDRERLTEIWRDTQKRANHFPKSAGSMVDPSKFNGVDQWEKTSRIFVFNETPWTVMDRAHGPLGEYLPFYVNECTIGTLESPTSQQKSHEAMLLRMSNLHRSWGVSPGDTLNYNAHWMFSPKATMFKMPNGAQRNKTYEFASLSVMFSPQPSVVTEVNGTMNYQSVSDANAAEDIIVGICKTAVEYQYPVMIITGLGIRQGHPPTRVAEMLKSALERFPVPIVLVTAGTGKYDQNDREYVELYHALTEE